MTDKSKLTDDELRDYLSKGIPQSQIAALYRVTPQAVSKRVKLLDKRSAVTAAAVSTAAEAVVSMWDTRAAAEENYQRCLMLLSECENPTERTRAIAEIRQHIQFGLQVIETLYTVQETKEFMNEVLDVIGQVDADARDTILRRLAEKRSLRAAFLPRG
jgi:DNA-binding Lrp family transcriptional regulator